ncbi:unnamed protein product [Mytilus edulis]|uniref:Uncharacterized protein n=1 Tax=Mytilus edulis TaxID=6550 RepID=A0A8S3SR04_MYTED|nr:unnamed protein product [Mytilus edulis]
MSTVYNTNNGHILHQIVEISADLFNVTNTSLREKSIHHFLIHMTSCKRELLNSCAERLSIKTLNWDRINSSMSCHGSSLSCIKSQDTSVSGVGMEQDSEPVPVRTLPFTPGASQSGPSRYHIPLLGLHRYQRLLCLATKQAGDSTSWYPG